MRQCAKCGVHKPFEEFMRRANSQRKFNAYCKACQRELCRAHYLQYKERYKERRHNRQAAYRARNRDDVQQYLRTHPCLDCGECDTRVLDFDHVDGRKVMNISTMVYTGVNLARIQAEILNCEVRCANCHRRKTAKQLAWHEFGA